MEAMSSFHPEKGVRHILFSGISDEELERSLRQKTDSLHGKVVPVRSSFSTFCTHVVACEFSPTEKILGALAAGKWLVPPNYIIDSYKEGRWLDEGKYEYTNFNNVAKYCRDQRKKKGWGPYAGWRILVMLGTPTLSRVFKRILAAGGAEIVSSTATSNIDFVITNPEMVKIARAQVGCLIRLVDITYIKDTLLLRADPADLQKYLVDSFGLQSSKICEAATSEVKFGYHSPKLNKSPWKRQTDETLGAKNKKFCLQPKQATMLKYMKPSPREPSSPLCQTPQIHANQLEKDSPSSCYVRKATSDQRRQISRSFESIHGKLVGSKSNQTSHQESAISKRKEGERKYFNNFVKTNGKKAEDAHVSDHAESCESKNIKKGCKKKEYHEIQSVNNLVTCATEFSCLQKNSKSSKEESSPEKMKHIVNKSNNCTTPMEVCQQTEMRVSGAKMTRITKDAIEKLFLEPYINLGRRVDEQTWPSKILSDPPLGCRKVSKPVERQDVQYKVSKYIVRKSDVTEALVHFLRENKCLNGYYCGSVLFLPSNEERFQSVKNRSSESEVDHEYILHTPNYGQYSSEVRELTDGEIGYYKAAVDQDAINDQDIVVHGLDSLHLHVSSTLYPPATILGDLLRRLALKTQFRMVHSRSMRLAYRILVSHPPVNAQMRIYYFRALESAMEPDELGSHMAWKFVKKVIDLLQGISDLDDDNEEEEEEEEEEGGEEQEQGPSEANKALEVLQFLVTLLSEDMKCPSYGEKVKELLTWRIFWGTSRNCYATTPPVKQLLLCWVSLRAADPAIRQSVAQLVSSLLEVTWRLNAESLFPINVLPDSFAAIGNEIKICLKVYCGHEGALQVIRSLPHPWARTVVCSILLQSFTQQQDTLSLRCILENLNAARKHENTQAVLQPESMNKVGNNAHSSPRKSLSLSSPRKNLMPSPTSRRTFHDGTFLEDQADVRKNYSDFTSIQGNLSLRNYKSVRPERITNKSAVFLISKEDEMEFFITFTNGYLEVSGDRYVFYTIKKSIKSCIMAHMKKQNQTIVNQVNCSIDNTSKEINVTENEQRAGVLENGMQKALKLCVEEASSRKNLPSKIEESTVNRMYIYYKLDAEVYRKQSSFKADVINTLDTKDIFRSLFL